MNPARPSTVAFAALLGPPVALAAALGLAGDAHAAPTGALSVQVGGLRSAKGKVGCTLYDGPRGFPKDPSAAVQQRWCAIEGTSALCPFAPSAPGTYAVACFHDENGNGKLDTGWFGIPTEGIAFSNDARGSFGPPSFDDAKFTLAPRPRTLALRVRY